MRRSSLRSAGSAASASNRASRYLRPRPPTVSVTCQPCQRASASLIANSLRPARRGSPISQAVASVPALPTVSAIEAGRSHLPQVVVAR